MTQVLLSALAELEQLPIQSFNQMRPISESRLILWISACYQTQLEPEFLMSTYQIQQSNTANGGNGACSGGTPSTITLYAITLTSKRTTSVVVKK